MKIVVGLSLSPQLEQLLLGDNVNYRPDLEFKGANAVEGMLEIVVPDVFISRAIPNTSALRLWRAGAGVDRSLLVVCVAEEHPTELPDGILVQWVAPASEEAELEAFKVAERFGRPRPSTGAVSPKLPNRQRVLMIGAGAVNLVTAMHLVNVGYNVELVEAGPDPRSPYEWRKHGCTFGGEDARIFSLNESRQHHFRGLDRPAGGPRYYRTHIAEDGWLYKPDLSLTADDRRWIREAERIPTWLLKEFNQEIISFNQESEPLWRHLFTNYPQILENAGFCKNLLRVYASRERYEKALLTERAIGAAREEISSEDLAVRYPSLAEAVAGGYIRGALEVVGFSVNIHRFCRNIVSWLEEQGVGFRWETKVSDVVRDGRGEVTGIRYAHGTLEADHFVASLGAFPGKLVEGAASAGQLKPMIGMWLTLPDTSPELDVPIKVTRSGFAAAGSSEGANVIAGLDHAGKKVIHISSGHGFIGSDASDLDPRALAELGRAVEETAQSLFPSKYAAAVDAKLVTEVQRFCIRPWTASGLGLFEVSQARDGMFILTGGHNTGGFAQSPAVARAVESALRGQPHPMHVLYHPERLTNFTGVHLGAV